MHFLLHPPHSAPATFRPDTHPSAAQSLSTKIAQWKDLFLDEQGNCKPVPAWEGLGGRIKALKRELVAKVDEDRVELGQANANVKLEADVSEVKAGQAEVKTGQAEVKADVMEVKADVAEVKANIEEMKAGQAEVKALLERLVAQSLQNSA